MIDIQRDPAFAAQIRRSNNDITTSAQTHAELMARAPELLASLRASIAITALCYAECVLQSRLRND